MLGARSLSVSRIQPALQHGLPAQGLRGGYCTRLL